MRKAMSGYKGTFEARETGRIARFKDALKSYSYVFVTFAVWLVVGTIIRVSYRKALKEGRPFYVDCLPFGRKKE